MQITRWAGAAVLGAAVALAAAAPGYAHHAAPELTAGTPGDCGEVTIGTGGWTADTHQVANAALVVQAGGEQHTAAVGEAITVGPFDTAEVTVRWRLWGGGERDYDDPALADLDALVAYLDADPEHSPLDPGAPGLAWHELTVAGCQPEPSPGPTPDPTPSSEPTGEPATEPTDPAESPPAGSGGGGDKLPRTGSALPVLLGVGGGAAGLGGLALWLGRRKPAPTA